MGLLKFNKELIITSIFISFCLIGYVFFPAEGIIQYRAVALVFLAILPFFYNKLILKKGSIFKQVSIGDWKKNIQWLMLTLLVASTLMFLFFKYSNFLDYYMLAENIKTDFKAFLGYELLGVAFTVAIYEFFFRGFIMFYYAKFFGRWSIAIQSLFFLVMLVMLNLPFWFYLAYLMFVPLAGLLAYKSNSTLYSFSGQLVFIILVDASFIALTSK